jgi:hypothetical protein
LDKKSGLVNLLYRKKSFYDEEKCVVYRDCKYFGLRKDVEEIDNKLSIKHSFVISNDYQDKSVSSYINFDNIFSDFILCIEYINDFIQNVINIYNTNHNIFIQKAYILLNSIPNEIRISDDDDYYDNREEISSIYNQITEKLKNAEITYVDDAIYSIDGIEIHE